MTVLVVSDSPHVGCRVAELISRIAGITVIGQLRNGEVALRCIAAEAPSLIIVDIHLAGGSGLDVIRRVKLLEHPPVVVAVSSSSHPQYCRQSMKSGADYCFQLPGEIDKLNDCLRGVT
jgi:DNA-binding NarL/FixJ family response regulator